MGFQTKLTKHRIICVSPTLLARFVCCSNDSAFDSQAAEALDGLSLTAGSEARQQRKVLIERIEWPGSEELVRWKVREREGLMLYLDSDMFFSENGGDVLEMNRFILSCQMG